ncbi:hypothetical protein ABII15_32800 [Streptomyces sp. HUAS MG91]|uniref:Uncharacterized protein n=1 Tax=Streptomyces tabacisoli TaxID=3156398 RepID=A0AAU8J1W3_9ACTN
MRSGPPVPDGCGVRVGISWQSPDRPPSSFRRRIRGPVALDGWCLLEAAAAARAGSEGP